MEKYPVTIGARNEYKAQYLRALCVLHHTSDYCSRRHRRTWPARVWL